MPNEIKKIFSCPATISKIETLSDGTIRARVDFQEVPAHQEVILFSVRKKLVYVVVAETDVEVDELDLPKIKLEHGEKSKSQRLRHVLYRLWEKTDRKKSSDEHYNEMMEKLIEWVKQKL